ncbi:MAG: DUF1315 family protein [Gammaproteobacteria bacterium]
MLEKKPDSLEALIEGITPEIYARLKTAIELGKWENGQLLSSQQLEHCLQAVIAYEHRKVPVDQRTGYIRPKPANKSACATGIETIASDRTAGEGNGTDET